MSSRNDHLDQLSPRVQGAKGKVNRPTAHLCDKIVGGKVVYFRKRKNNPRPGETPYYNGQMIKGGTPCRNLAVVTFNREGKTIRRCLDHLQA